MKETPASKSTRCRERVSCAGSGHYARPNYWTFSLSPSAASGGIDQATFLRCARSNSFDADLGALLAFLHAASKTETRTCQMNTSDDGDDDGMFGVC